MKKYYAVKKGSKIGVFETWEECQEATKGFSGAQYKAFPTLEEAKAFVDGIELSENTIKDDIQAGYAVAYTDGSYNKDSNRYSYGIVCIDLSGNEIELYNSGNNQKYLDSNNIIGEILGAINAMDWAVLNGYSKLKIYHDYEGISKWITGEWKTNSEAAKMYVAIYNDKYKDLLEISFCKVKGHSNNKYNERADQLAKNALVDRKKKVIKGETWYAIPLVDEKELTEILDKLKSLDECIDITKTEDNNRIICKIKMKKDSLTVTLFKNGRKKLLVQGAVSNLSQIFITFITGTTGKNTIEKELGSVYRIAIDFDLINDKYNSLNLKLPSNYPENLKCLIKQAIINLTYMIDGVEYGYMTFPALEALEGHIKYLFKEQHICITNSFNVFDKDSNNDYVLQNAHKSKMNSEIATRIEKYYNYYYSNRHSIFHFGEFIGDIDTTRMVLSKEEAKEVINKCLEYICE